MTSSDDRREFFIGYTPPLPPSLAAFITRTVLIGSAVIVAGVATVAVGHTRLTGGVFEFGRTRTVTGTIVARPYPALVPDQSSEAGGTKALPWMLLVAPGKHGADSLVREWHGVHVKLAGTHIERDGMAMIEVQPDSIASFAEPPAAPSGALGDRDTRFGRETTLRGEIVDSKCYLGVMTPGDGRTHTACASLCVRGGIPPALLVRDRAGRSVLFLLEDPSGRSVAARAADVAGAPIELRGVSARRGAWLVLRSDPATWRPIGATP